MTPKLQSRRGRVLFHRLGTLKPVRQNYWKRAPDREGLWAFPWPYFSMFFAWHQYRALAPRRFATCPEDESQEEAWVKDQERWFQEVAPRVLPIRRFWYDGFLYTHLERRGRDLGLDDWERVPARDFVERAACYLSRDCRFDDRVHARSPSILDHETLEVFIPTRAGRFEPERAP